MVSNQETGGEAHRARPPAAKEWVDRVQRWDPVGVVLVAHAVFLLILGNVASPSLTLALAGTLGAWRLVMGVAIHRSQSGWSTRWVMFREAGSLMLAAGVMVADGGTESPFFFWPLILLAWQALHLTAGQFGALVATAIAAYLGVMAAVPDVTVTSMGRLGLLMAFCGIMLVGLVQREQHRRQAESSERLVRDAFSLAPMGLLVVSVEPPHTVHANRMAGRMRIDEALRHDEEQLRALRRLVDTAWDQQTTIGPELFVQRRKERDPRYFRVFAAPHNSSDDKTVIVCAEDVTDQVNIGEERRSFLRFAGHQLRTPLTPIVAYSDLLQRGSLDPDEVRSAAAEIQQASEELDRLCERMLAVARLQHASPSDIVSAQVNEVISRIDSGIVGNVRISGDPDEAAKCNPELVAQALTELLDNSNRFGEPPIHMRWFRTEDAIEFQVWDSGPGPDPDASDEALFADWGELEPTKMMTPRMGSRLGLVHARLLAHLSAGELSFRRSGTGWAFVLRLPAPLIGAAVDSSGLARKTT